MVLLLAASCTTSSPYLYDWGDYERGNAAMLLDHDSSAALTYYEETLNELQRRQGRVPPGLYADYGFLLYLHGNYDGALRGFESEKRLFPEAAPLMDKLIARVRERQGLAGSTAPGVPAPTPPYSSTDSRPPNVEPAP